MRVHYTHYKKLRPSKSLAENSETAQGETAQEHLLKLLTQGPSLRGPQVRTPSEKRDFYSLNGFDEFWFDEVKPLLSLTPEELKRCAFIDKKRNLILYIDVGTGKARGGSRVIKPYMTFDILLRLVITR